MISGPLEDARQFPSAFQAFRHTRPPFTRRDTAHSTQASLDSDNAHLKARAEAVLRRPRWHGHVP
jgi:hypothetical protein